MSSSSNNSLSVIHIRDFIDFVSVDRSRVEIHTDLNIFEEASDFHDDRICVEPIHCCVHTFLNSQSERELYDTDVYFYADGRFYTSVIEDKLRINVQALSLTRYNTFKSSFTQSFF